MSAAGRSEAPRRSPRSCAGPTKRRHAHAGGLRKARAVTSRIDATFARLRAARRTALIPYVTAGDPSPASTVAILHALVAAGADVVELGVPFSDPMADGPVIQRASERALAQHVGCATFSRWCASSARRTRRRRSC